MSARISASGVVRWSVIVLVALIFAIFAGLAWQGYGNTLDKAKDKAASAAATVAAEARWLLGASLVVLEGVQSEVNRSAQLNPLDLQSLDASLDLLPSQMSLVIYDQAGAEIAVIQGRPISQDISETPLFKEFQEGRQWKVSPGGGELGIEGPAFLIARRLEVGGVFSGVAIADLDVAVMHAFWAPLQLGTGGTVSLIRDDGWVVARYPALETPMDIRSRSTFQDQMASTQSGTYDDVSPVDGVQRIVAYQHLPELGLISLASLSLAATIGSFWYSVTVVLALLIPVSLALLAGSLWTARILRKLETALEQNKVLFGEIHHRVKNNLQSVASLIRLQRLDPEIRDNIISRIDAMSAVHEHLYRSDKFDAIETHDYLNAVIDGIRQSQHGAIRVERSIENVEVSNDAAMPLGLIINEVFTNAYKYAFPVGQTNQTIAIVLKRTGINLGTLTIHDNGIGFDPNTVTKGMGSRLIIGLASQLDGEATYASDGGCKFVLTFKLDPHI